MYGGHLSEGKPGVLPITGCSVIDSKSTNPVHDKAILYHGWDFYVLKGRRRVKWQPTCKTY